LNTPAETEQPEKNRMRSFPVPAAALEPPIAIGTPTFRGMPLKGRTHPRLSAAQQDSPLFVPRIQCLRYFAIRMICFAIMRDLHTILHYIVRLPGSRYEVKSMNMVDAEKWMKEHPARSLPLFTGYRGPFDTYEEAQATCEKLNKANFPGTF
jgi:hypothetical protein